MPLLRLALPLLLQWQLVLLLRQLVLSLLLLQLLWMLLRQLVLLLQVPPLLGLHCSCQNRLGLARQTRGVILRGWAP